MAESAKILPWIAEAETLLKKNQSKISYQQPFLYFQHYTILKPVSNVENLEFLNCRKWGILNRCWHSLVKDSLVSPNGINSSEIY